VGSPPHREHSAFGRSFSQQAWRFGRQRLLVATCALLPPTLILYACAPRMWLAVPAIVALPISHSVTRTADLYRSQRTEDTR